MNPRPDDDIFRVKEFINELSKVQDSYFEGLCKRLALEDGAVKDYLFDYVYNENKPVTFGEYLDNYNLGNLWDGL